MAPHSSGSFEDALSRRIDGLAERVATLAENIAAFNVRLQHLEDAVEQVEKETSGLNKLANRGMGLFLALTLLGGALGGFWDRLSRLWGH